MLFSRRPNEATLGLVPGRPYFETPRGRARGALVLLACAVVPHVACSAIFGLDELQYDAVGGSTAAGGHGAVGGGGGSGVGGHAGTGAGTPAPNCGGAWGAPTIVFPEGALPASPSIARGDLELTYIRGELDGGTTPMRSARSSTAEAFPAAQPADDLQNVCDVPAGEQTAGVDLSEDGLRAYLSCEVSNDTANRMLYRQPRAPWRV